MGAQFVRGFRRRGCRNFGCVAALCRFPARSDLSDLASNLGPLRSHLLAWSERSGIPLLDLTEPLLTAARADRVPWFWGDTHWNAEGHAVAAKALAAWNPVRKLRAY